MHWELWDRQSANLIEEFDSEEEALQGVREMLAVNSPDLIDELSVGATYDEGEPHEVELPPSLYGENLKARLAELALDSAAEASRRVHAQIRKWLTEENWHIDDVPVPAGSFNVVALRHSGQAINIFQPEDVLDHIALSLRWSHARAQQMIGEFHDSKLEEIRWNIYRDASLMGVDIYDAIDSTVDMILRTHVYFDGLTKDTLMQRILLVNRAYALAMRMSVRAVEMHGRETDRTFSPEDLRRITRPVLQADDPLTLAS